MLFIGADPGINGALAALICGDSEGPAFISDAIDIPTMADGKNREVDVLGIEEWVLRLPEKPARAFIENVTPMPSFEKPGVKRRSMGAASAFRFGGAAYALRTVFRMMRIKVELTHPATWKAHFQLRGGDKESSRLLALRMHPEAAHLLRRMKDHQRAEAMLLARHAAELRGVVNGG
jgi:crossover junction endodeoxyribonuclease RuvC